MLLEEEGGGEREREKERERVTMNWSIVINNNLGLVQPPLINSRITSKPNYKTDSHMKRTKEKLAGKQILYLNY